MPFDMEGGMETDKDTDDTPGFIDLAEEPIADPDKDLEADEEMLE